MRRVLIVEDDPRIGAELKDLLTREKLAPTLAPSLKDARKALRAQEFDLLLLDVELPDGTGFELCGEVREEDAQIPVVFLTARVDEDSAVKGLTLGGTDFVRKPFGPKELVARLRRHLKEAPAAIRIGALDLDPKERRASWNGKAVTLTPREFEILSELARHVGNLVTRERLLEQIDADAEINDGAIKTYVSRLKTKLRDAGVDSIEIVAVTGSGYRLEKT